jgi:hypothetical protein
VQTAFADTYSVLILEIMLDEWFALFAPSEIPNSCWRLLGGQPEAEALSDPKIQTPVAFPLELWHSSCW